MQTDISPSKKQTIKNIEKNKKKLTEPEAVILK